MTGLQYPSPNVMVMCGDPKTEVSPHMKSNLAFADSAALALPEQPSSSEAEIVTTVELCRDVIDDMMDRALLGLLLSSTHFRRYLAAYSTYAPKAHAATLRRSLSNVEITDALHMQMLTMFKGLYIAEARITNANALMAHLDQVYTDYSSSIDLIDVRYETSLTQLESVELAWRYRSACAMGTQIGEA